MKSIFKRFVKGVLYRLGYDISRVVKTPPPAVFTIQPWQEDKEFGGLYDAMKGYTLVDIYRCFMLYQFAHQVSSLPGDVAEAGVYKGGTARLLAGLFGPSGKKVHLFDTFEGMPETDPEKDIHEKGDFNDTSLNAVKRLLKGCVNAVFYPGFFPDTAGPVKGSTFCLVHIDTDIYRSVLDGCDFFYPRMDKGGIMVFDDYGFLSCPGAKAAVDEFFAAKPESPCYLTTGQCIVVKL